jgi:geranylgeranyl diphosphate synthase type II
VYFIFRITIIEKKYNMQSATQLSSLFEAYYKKQKFDQRYDVYRAMEYIMSMNGKRIRPLLTLMACELFGGDVKKAMAPAIGRRNLSQLYIGT